MNNFFKNIIKYQNTKACIIIVFIMVFPFMSFSQPFSFQQKITSDNRQLFSLFGVSATFHENYLLIGSLNEDAAYLYEKKLNKWDPIQTLTPSDNTGNNFFGVSVFMNDSIIIIGANADDLAMGAIYIYEKDLNGIWIEKQKIIPPVILRDSENFGTSVTIFKDRLIIGAPRDNHDALESNPISEAGSAYVFEKDMTGTWVYANQKLVASVTIII